MSHWGYPHPYFTGADELDPAAALDPAAIDPGAAIADDAAAAAALAQQQAIVAQQAAAQQAALLAQQQLAQPVLPEIAPLPTVRRHHLWRRLNGSMFRTLIGTQRDFQAQRLAAHGRLFRVAGETAVGASGELYFQVTHPAGAMLRWQDASLQEGHSAIPYGTIFQGTLRPHELVEISLPGFIGWVNVYELNQLGATQTGAELAGAALPDHTPPMPPPPTPMPTAPCPPGMMWDPNLFHCVPVTMTPATFTGVDPWGPLAPTCPSGMQWKPDTLQCVPLQMIPPPPPVSTLHATSGWDLFHDVFGVKNPLPWHQHEDAWFRHRELEDLRRHEHERQFAGYYGVGAEPQTPQEHARASQEHAQQRDAHAHESQHHPSAEGRDHHAREAQRHHEHAAHHERRAHEEHHREARRGIEHGHGRGRFEHPAHGFGRGGFARRGHGGFSRHYHAHPEWHRVGHPAWRHGIGARWHQHRAECAQAMGVGAGIGAAILGPIGALFGMGAAKKGCLIEKIVHPQGHITYRVTPAGEQQGTVLDLSQISANTQYTQSTGQQPPTAEDGPMPGSSEQSSGAQPADPGGDDKDKHGDAGDAGGADADQAPSGGDDAAQPDASAQADAGAQADQDTSAQAAQYHAQGYFTGAACGPYEYWDDGQKACIPLAIPQTPVGPAPHCPPGQFFDYFRQACVSASTHAAGAPCGQFEYWDDATKACIPLALPQVPAGPVPHCGPGQFWDYLRQACVSSSPHTAGYAYGFEPYGFDYDYYVGAKLQALPSLGRPQMLPSLGHPAYRGF